jgi:hypothetical protein
MPLSHCADRSILWTNDRKLPRRKRPRRMKSSAPAGRVPAMGYLWSASVSIVHGSHTRQEPTGTASRWGIQRRRVQRPVSDIMRTELGINARATPPRSAIGAITATPLQSARLPGEEGRRMAIQSPQPSFPVCFACAARNEDPQVELLDFNHFLAILGVGY